MVTLPREARCKPLLKDPASLPDLRSLGWGGRPELMEPGHACCLWSRRGIRVEGHASLGAAGAPTCWAKVSLSPWSLEVAL